MTRTWLTCVCHYRIHRWAGCQCYWGRYCCGEKRNSEILGYNLRFCAARVSSTWNISDDTFYMHRHYVLSCNSRRHAHDGELRVEHRRNSCTRLLTEQLRNLDLIVIRTGNRACCQYRRNVCAIYVHYFLLFWLPSVGAFSLPETVGCKGS